MKSFTPETIRASFRSTQTLPSAMLDLLNVAVALDRACKELPYVPPQLLDAQQSLHDGLILLYDWGDSVTGIRAAAELN